MAKTGNAQPTTAGGAVSINTNNMMFAWVWLYTEHQASSQGIQLSLHDFKLKKEKDLKVLEEKENTDRNRCKRNLEQKKDRYREMYLRMKQTGEMLSGQDLQIRKKCSVQPSYASTCET